MMRLTQGATLLRPGTDLAVVCECAGLLAGVITKTDVVHQNCQCHKVICVTPTSLVMTREVVFAYAVRLAEEVILPRADLRTAGIQLVVHAAGGLLVLLVPAALSMYKPPGTTPYGRRKLNKQPALSRP